jgi:hypothetical protein
MATSRGNAMVGKKQFVFHLFLNPELALSTKAVEFSLGKLDSLKVNL